MPYELFLALRYLRFHRGRTFLSIITLISVAGVTVGTAALVIALALNAGFVQDVRARIHSGSAHLTVMAPESLFEGAVPLIQRAEAVEGIAAAGPVLYSPAMLAVDGSDSPAYAEIHGIDPVAHSRVVHGAEAPAPDDVFALLEQVGGSGRHGIVLGYELARELHVGLGDLVRAVVPRVHATPWGVTPRHRVFEVVGTFRSDHFQQDAQRAWVHIDAARRLVRAPERTSWLEVRLDDLNQLEPMKHRLEAALGPSWLVIDLLEQNQELLKALNTEKLLLFLAIGLIIVVAALNIISTLVLMVTDKLKEIGTLGAMGARPGQIATVFVLQGWIIGCVGTVMGLVLGWVLANAFDRYQLFRLDPDVYYLTHVPFAPQTADVVMVGLAALAISLTATIYPALKAARLDPVEAIRYE